MSDDIPQWVKERAWKLINKSGGPVTALARYIAKHEKPPVDPDLITAREICAGVADESYLSDLGYSYRDGTYDNAPDVQFILAALKEARNA